MGRIWGARKPVTRLRNTRFWAWYLQQKRRARSTIKPCLDDLIGWFKFDTVDNDGNLELNNQIGDSLPPTIQKGQSLLFDGTKYLLDSSIVGTETVTNEGNAVLTISAGKISATAGNAWDIEVSNGLWIPGTNSTTDDVPSTSNDTTLVGSISSFYQKHIDGDGFDSNILGYSVEPFDDPELVTNGTFDTDVSGWDGYSGAILTNNAQRLDITTGTASRGFAQQSVPVVIGQTYSISFDVISGTSNGRCLIGSTVVGVEYVYPQNLSTGNYVYTVKATTNTLSIAPQVDLASLGVNCLFDNISVKAIQNLVENGEASSDRDWTKGTGWTISGGLFNCDGTQVATSALSTDDYIMHRDRAYSVSFDAVITAGAIGVWKGGVSAAVVNGSNSVVLPAEANASMSKLAFSANGDFIGSVDNVVVEEIPAIENVYPADPSATTLDVRGDSLQYPNPKLNLSIISESPNTYNAPQTPLWINADANLGDFWFTSGVPNDIEHADLVDINDQQFIDTDIALLIYGDDISGDCLEETNKYLGK